MRKVFQFVFVVCGALAALAGCAKEEEVKQESAAYDGPLFEFDSIRILYSDSAIVRVMLTAPKQFDYFSGNSEYPKGFYIEFYEVDGSISSTLQADKGYFFKEENRYTGIGNVEIESLKDNNLLLTDTLHWSPPEQKMYTKSKVVIIEGADTLRGQGLEAAQDFSSYTILQPEGSTIFAEDEAEETDIENEEN